MKKLYLLFIFYFTLISCEENNNLIQLNSGLPYFEFKSEDNLNLLELPEPNKEIIFENQNSEKLTFEVIKSQNQKELHSTGSWVYGSTKYFYYDEQKLYLRSTLFDINDIHSYLEIKVKRWPSEFNDGRNGRPKIISDESKLTTNIDYGPFNNRGQNISVSYLNKMTLIVNGIEYNKVIKVDLTSRESISNNWNTPSLDYIYFDINKGILRFDDKQGNIWNRK
jgi:hypothetical protein